MTQVSGTATFPCDWRGCARAPGNRFERETYQTQSHVQTEGKALRFGWQSQAIYLLVLDGTVLHLFSMCEV